MFPRNQMFAPSAYGVTTVTREIAKAWGTEHPIGDPFGGPLNGDKDGWFSNLFGGGGGGILGGIGSILAGVAVIASGGTLAPLMGGLMIAGGAMSTIGSISGNATLSKIGGITSVVGGIGAGSMAIYDNWGAITESVGSFLSSGTESTATAADLAAGGTSAAEAASGTMTDIPGLGWNNAAAEGASTASQMSMANTPAAFNPASVSGAYNGGGFVDQMTAELGNQINQTAPFVSDSLAANVNPSNMWASTQGTVDAGGAMQSIGSSAKSLSANQGLFAVPEVTNSTASSIGSTPGIFNTSSTPSAFQAATGEIGAYGGDLVGGSSGNGLLASVGGFIKDNPLASMMGMQALSGLAQGASPKSQAEGDYLKAMADLKAAEESYLQAHQDFMNGPKTAETQANTEYLQAKAAEFDKTKAYAEEKRKAYNDSIAGLQMPSNFINYNTSLFNKQPATTNAGLINGAVA